MSKMEVITTSAAGADDRARQVRKLAYVAKALMTKRYRYRAGAGYQQVEHTVFTAQYPRQFRRAFVEASLAPPFEVRLGEGRARTFIAGGQEIASLDAHGQLSWRIGSVSPISLAPRNVATVARFGLTFFWQDLLARYEALIGLPKGCISGGNDGIDRRYWPPETQQKIRGAETYEEKELAIGASTPLLEIHSLAGGYAGSKYRRVTGLAIQAIKTFCAGLHEDQLRALRRAQVVDSGYRSLAERVTGGTYWLQALVAYPALLRMACYCDVPASIAAAIDRGLPLIPALADHFGIPEAAVRRFRDVTPQRVGVLPNRQYAQEIESLRFIADLPPHLRPRTRADFQVAFRLYTMLTPVPWGDPFNDEGREGSIPSIDVRTLTRGMKLPLGKEPRIAALNGLADVERSLILTFGRPRAYELLGALPLGRLVDLNVAWHRAQQQAAKHAAEQASSLPETRWPGLLPNGRTELGQGLVAVELTSMQELLQEGAALAHCVGGYYGLCFEGTSRIVSLRSADGASRSTIEFRQQGPSSRRAKSLVIEQHYAARNTRPAAEDQAAAATLLMQLQPIASMAWPELSPPESLDAFTHRVVQEWITRFFHAWFGMRQDDSEQLPRRIE